jgi:hypothetical protein
MQDSDEVRALLFLHTIPWQGVKTIGEYLSEVLMFDKYTDWGIGKVEDSNTRVLSHKAMFSVNSAFIHAPKAWVLLIGAMLWRRRYYLDPDNKPKLTDPIVWFDKISDNNFEPLIKGYNNTKFPTTRQFLYYSEDGYEPWGMFLNNENDAQPFSKSKNIYTPIDKTIAGLPRSVKNQFINYFENWVNDETNGFKYFQKELEIWYGRDSNKGDDAKEFGKYKAKWFQFNSIRIPPMQKNY